MIDICALGPLRVTSGLFNAGLLKSGAKVSKSGAGLRNRYAKAMLSYLYFITKKRASILCVSEYFNCPFLRLIFHFFFSR